MPAPRRSTKNPPSGCLPFPALSYSRVWVFERVKKEGRKQPLYICMKDGGPMIFAGLWESWKSPEAEIIETCTILTTNANSLIRPIHDRMPVILGRSD